MEILDPTGDVPGDGGRTVTSRLDGLSGKRLGMIWNGRRPGPGREILLGVADVLDKRHGLAEVFLLEKPYLGNAAPSSMLDELANRADFSIAGVGD